VAVKTLGFPSGKQNALEENAGGCFKASRRGTALKAGVKNMWEIVLGLFVLIGVFVFWCDVTDSWNKVLPGKKDRRR